MTLSTYQWNLLSHPHHHEQCNSGASWIIPSHAVKKAVLDLQCCRVVRWAGNVGAGSSRGYVLTDRETAPKLLFGPMWHPYYSTSRWYTGAGWHQIRTQEHAYSNLHAHGGPPAPLCPRRNLLMTKPSRVKGLIYPINFLCQQKFPIIVTFRRRACADGVWLECVQTHDNDRNLLFNAVKKRTRLLLERGHNLFWQFVGGFYFSKSYNLPFYVCTYLCNCSHYSYRITFLNHTRL